MEENHFREFLYQTYDMVLERLKYAEAKNTIIVTLLGALVVGGFRIYNETPYRPDIATFYFWNFILFAVIAITVSLSSFMPNVKLQYLYKGKDPAESDSLVYYEHISKYDVESYLTAINRRYFDSEATPGNLDFDVAAQLIINSRSAYRKYSISYYAIVFSIFAILTPVVGIIYFFLNSRIHLTVQDGKTKIQYGKIKFIEDIRELSKTKKRSRRPENNTSAKIPNAYNSKFFTPGISSKPVPAPNASGSKTESGVSGLNTAPKSDEIGPEVSWPTDLFLEKNNQNSESENMQNAQNTADRNDSVKDLPLVSSHRPDDDEI
ncbi:Pycsar system effector family protein [Methanolapillus ohkumae]|uniref:Pycsar effector protein domain-containing protein n=1 Tax=Methanolapillus ohkumae TaxID=3028298 RepID=A0AA96V5R9_9EURY|nr:hypothetical protein MsAm2_01410 [Methanosarcinaceae archaeon Am2]